MFPLDFAFQISLRLKLSILAGHCGVCLDAHKPHHMGGEGRRVWSPRPTWATQPDLGPRTKNLVLSKGMHILHRAKPS